MAAQRLRQGVRALLAFSQPVDEELAAKFLAPSLKCLFDTMQQGERLHSVNVLRSVLAQGSTPRDLAVAALLHDVGKSRSEVRVWQKTAVVLVQKFVPRLYARWSVESPAMWWRRPFAVKAHHPVWGAELVQQAGGSELTVWLIAHHQESLENWRDHPHYDLLRRLQQADDAN